MTDSSLLLSPLSPSLPQKEKEGWAGRRKGMAGKLAEEEEEKEEKADHYPRTAFSGGHCAGDYLPAADRIRQDQWFGSSSQQAQDQLIHPAQS